MQFVHITQYQEQVIMYRRHMLSVIIAAVFAVIALGVTTSRIEAGTNPQFCLTINRTNISLNEAVTGLTRTVTVKLNQAPPAYSNITVYPDAAQPDFTVSPASRVLTTNNWNTGRTFTFSVVNDLIDEVDPEFSYTGFYGVLNMPHQSPLTIYACTSLTIGIHDNDSSDV